MAAVKYLLYFILFILFIVAALLFSFRNESIVPVDFVLFQAPSLSIGGWIIASFLVGTILGWLAALPKRLSLNLINRQRNKQLESKQKELSRLKGDSGNR